LTPNSVGNAIAHNAMLPLSLRITDHLGQSVAILKSNRYLDVINDQGVENPTEVFCASSWIAEHGGRDHELEARRLENILSALGAVNTPLDTLQE
jgi:hypothetical protein